MFITSTSPETHEADTAKQYSRGEGHRARFYLFRLAMLRLVRRALRAHIYKQSCLGDGKQNPARVARRHLAGIWRQSRSARQLILVVAVIAAPPTTAGVLLKAVATALTVRVTETAVSSAIAALLTLLTLLALLSLLALLALLLLAFLRLTGAESAVLAGLIEARVGSESLTTLLSLTGRAIVSRGLRTARLAHRRRWAASLCLCIGLQVIRRSACLLLLLLLLAIALLLMVSLRLSVPRLSAAIGVRGGAVTGRLR